MSCSGGKLRNQLLSVQENHDQFSNTRRKCAKHTLLYVMSTYGNRPATFVAGAFVYIDMNIEMINKQILSGCYPVSECTMALEKGEKESWVHAARRTRYEGMGFTEQALE